MVKLQARPWFAYLEKKKFFAPVWGLYGPPTACRVPQIAPCPAVYTSSLLSERPRLLLAQNRAFANHAPSNSRARAVSLRRVWQLDNASYAGVTRKISAPHCSQGFWLIIELVCSCRRGK